MISFGHYALTDPNHPMISQYSQFTSSCAQQIHQGHQNSSKNLPLTPPGSPDDVGRPLVICESPQKTPIRENHIESADAKESQPTIRNTESAIRSLNFSTYSPIENPGFMLTSDSISAAMNRPSSALSSINRRSREKKPIPDTLKDEKYYERRRRNNAAAKKSRDNRKNREDEIVARAACLENENAILRAQVSTLREEAQNLRLLLLQKRERMSEATTAFCMP